MTGTKGKCFVERRVSVRPRSEKRGERRGELTEAAAAVVVVCNHHHRSVVGVGAIAALAVIAASVAASLPL